MLRSADRDWRAPNQGWGVPTGIEERPYYWRSVERGGGAYGRCGGKQRGIQYRSDNPDWGAPVGIEKCGTEGSRVRNEID